MRSIIIGFAEERGTGRSRIVCDANVSDIEQSRVFVEAKRKGKYPKGIVRLEQRFFDDSMTEIAIAVPSLVAS